MKWRITMDMSFEELPPRDMLERIVNYCENHCVIINPRQPNEERGYIRLLKCHHDEASPAECELIEEHTCSNISLPPPGG